MSLIALLKSYRDSIINYQKESENIDIYNLNSINIVIENHNEYFENEIEIIKNGAKSLLENNGVTSIEEGIIVFATVFRGLKFKRIENDEEGNITVFLKDNSLEIKKNLCI